MKLSGFETEDSVIEPERYDCAFIKERGGASKAVLVIAV